MGLPVHQIFATLEEQIQILDEEPAGDPEEELDDEGQGADDLSEMKVELVEGDHGVNWLVVDGVHILHKNCQSICAYLFRFFKCLQLERKFEN